MSEPSNNPADTGIKPGPAPVAAGSVAAAPPKPGPAKPAPAKPGAGQTRRGFLETIGLSWVFLGWSSFILSMLGMLLYTFRFLAPNAPPQQKSRFLIRWEEVEALVPNEVSDKYKELGFWVIKSSEGASTNIYALSTICTHLGCNPNWLAGEKKFKCPCHGSGFYISGVNFEGPAPRPLERFQITREGNFLIVDKSVKFQKELGEWNSNNPQSLPA